MFETRPQIRALENDLVNKIAAGEVVERPASVVKELVENSLDAGSTQITIAISDGGRKLIRITDNGIGILPEELELAVARHATSKIGSFEDIYRLHTKGFRGEALASIASVSKLTLTSKTSNSEATELIVHGGELIDKRAAAHGQGTTVEVKHLFYKTPARLKFLRSQATETSHIEDVVTKLALSHPHVEFLLLRDNEVILHAPILESLQNRVAKILGKDVSEFLYPFSGSVPGMSVHGFLGHPQAARSQRNQAYFFVNGRAVNDKVLWHAAMESYRDLLMKGKYPVLIMDLKVDEATLDVNVHPQKSEIRFHQGQQIHSFVYEVLRKHLLAKPWIDSSAKDVSDNHESFSTSFNKTDDNEFERTFAQSMGNTSDSTAKNYSSVSESLKSWGNNYQKEQSNAYFLSTDQRIRDKSEQNPMTIPLAQNELRFGKTSYAEMRPIGQLFGTYILCETPKKLILVDQHAAHERIGFEKLMLDFKKNGITTEPLLVAETFDLKPSDTEILKNYLDELGEFGIEIDFFGGNTFVVKSLPSIFKNHSGLTALIADILADLKETGALVALKDKLHHIFATMACHGQIRAHHRLTIEEMSALLKELDEYQFTDFCPHGRPVCVEIPEADIQKWFRRIL